MWIPADESASVVKSHLDYHVHQVALLLEHDVGGADDVSVRVVEGVAVIQG